MTQFFLCWLFSTLALNASGLPMKSKRYWLLVAALMGLEIVGGVRA